MSRSTEPTQRRAADELSRRAAHRYPHPRLEVGHFELVSEVRLAHDHQTNVPRPAMKASASPRDRSSTPRIPTTDEMTSGNASDRQYDGASPVMSSTSRWMGISSGGAAVRPIEVGPEPDAKGSRQPGRTSSPTARPACAIREDAARHPRVFPTFEGASDVMRLYPCDLTLAAARR